ncbi:MAG: hypothetical protein LBQ42_02380 [Synergistaceae bacterium]|jgi:hypothetical protein|nr:hypothetical protein [Synergistaceae bacterium]
MSVSSVTSDSSIWWEERLEKQKKLQQQAQQAIIETGSGEAGSASSLNPSAILSELQSLEDNPEELKAKAAELLTQVTEEAAGAAGGQARMLKELAADLEAVAAGGDLSAMEEKLGRGAGGMTLRGPGGMSGGTSASIKWLEALLAEEDENEDSDTSAAASETIDETVENLVARLQELRESDNAVSTDTAGDAEGAALTVSQTSLDDRISQLKTNLSNQFLKLYSQQAQYSSLDLSA